MTDSSTFSANSSDKTVMEVLSDRVFARHNNESYNDDARLCLAVEGGAMRGVISSGMLIALYDLGLLDLFDDYVGVSAGSLNLAYTLADQGALGLSVYFEDMTDKDIVNLLRFRSKEHPIMDMHKLYDHTTKNKRLDIERLKARYETSFRVSVTNVTKNTGELISLKDAGKHFDEFLISGAILPFIAGEPWIIGENEYYDGSMHYIDPSQAARDIGATHTMVLYTRTQDKPLKPYGRLVERRIRSFDSHYPNAGTHYLEALRATIEEYGNLPYGDTMLGPMKLYRHALPNSVGVGRITMDSEKLVGGVKAGYQSILSIFYPNGKVGILPTMM